MYMLGSVHRAAGNRTAARAYFDEALAMAHGSSAVKDAAVPARWHSSMTWKGR